MSKLTFVRGLLVMTVAVAMALPLSACGKRGKLKRPSDVSAVEIPVDVNRG